MLARRLSTPPLVDNAALRVGGEREVGWCERDFGGYSSLNIVGPQHRTSDGVAHIRHELQMQYVEERGSAIRSHLPPSPRHPPRSSSRSTPSPCAYATPKLFDASAYPLSADMRYHLTASTGSCSTPSPCISIQPTYTRMRGWDVSQLPLLSRIIEDN